MPVDRDELGVLADRILATLDGFSASELQALGAGLRMAEPPLDRFGGAVRDLIVNREEGHEPDRLVRMNMVSALRQASWSPIPRALEEVEDPFWVAIRDALVEIAEDSLSAA